MKKLSICSLLLAASLAVSAQEDNSIENVFGPASTVTGLTEGLVAYYNFEGDYRDQTSYGNNATPRSASLTEGVSGMPNSGCQFGGPSNPGSVFIHNSASLRIENGWSFACWVKITSTRSMNGYGYTSNDGPHTIFAKSHDRHGFVIFCNLNGGKFNTWLGGFASWTGGINANLQGDYLNKWVHVAYVYSDHQFKVYLNGECKNTKNVTPDFSAANGQDMYLGKFSDSWYPMNGVLDEVRIYNRGLMESEVMSLAVR